jgi:hypothetical protein
LRDGFGEVGRFDHRALYYQTQHEHPISGGFVARLSPALREKYLLAPVLRPLLQLSDGPAPEPARPIAYDREAGARALRGLSFKYVVLDDTAPAHLQEYVFAALPLKPVAKDGTRQLFEISPAAADQK